MKKEKIIMFMSSVFVLSALTVTGVYVREKNAAGKDGYIVDLSEMEDQVSQKSDDIAAVQPSKQNVMENDLDYDPGLAADSADVQNPGLEKAQDYGMDQEVNGQAEEEAKKEKTSDSDPGEKQESGENKEVSRTSAQVAQAVHFSETDGLQWPISGNVLLNFSMDKTVFFPTLKQYKYNPAIVIEAEEGENIVAAASGEVTKIYSDAETGETIVMNLGDGYELTYGQLSNIQVHTGDYVEAGKILGTVAAPTKYYSVEGSNVYFKLTKDGVPVNPLGKLG
ncbi:MAG: M23 family metallopeptidase [Clostridiales bacterium]|nr:M23 family metallopeptidase [Clostridiales bacterium]